MGALRPPCTIMDDNFKANSHNAICDRCGFKFKAYQLSKEWTGLRVCAGPDTNDCFDDRHPQDLVKGRAERPAPSWTRPEPTDTFITTDVTQDDL